MSRRLSFLVLPLLLCFAYAAHSALTTVTVSVAAGPAGPQRVAFTALHTYYMSPTGSDSNSGTSPSSAWATPNHPVDCGDVIIAAPGAYTDVWINSSTPSNCPSNSGGIDGTGGIYFATVLCNGGVGACYVNGSGNGGAAFEVDDPNWAVEGWRVSSDSIGSSGQRGFQSLACGSGTERIGHIAFINDIAYHAENGYTIGDCGTNHDVPGNGVDYFAVVGSIAQNANDDPICLAAIDDVGPANVDTNQGVHVFFGGDFAIANQNPDCGGSDGEGIMFDTWDAHGYVGTGVIENNIVYGSSWSDLQVFMQNYNSSAPDVQIFDNTLFHSNTCAPWSTYASGGMNFQLNGGFPWTVDVYDNIDYEDLATTGTGSVCGNTHNSGGGGGAVYAMDIGGGANGPGRTVFTAGGSGIQNVFKGSRGACVATVCDPGDNVGSWNSFSYGTNTYQNPGFANTADLLANHVGPPSCTGYTNTTACMGWNYSAQTAAADSVIGDLAPTATGTSGKGYQPPGACKADSYYPSWLKGIVYLQWDGANMWEYNGLAQKPCGL